MKKLHEPSILDQLVLQFDFRALHARDIKEVFHQPADQIDLSFDHASCPVDVGFRFAAVAEHLGGIADRPERIAQLVGEEGDELVLAIAGLIKILGTPTEFVQR